MKEGSNADTSTGMVVGVEKQSDRGALKGQASETLQAE